MKKKGYSLGRVKWGYLSRERDKLDVSLLEGMTVGVGVGFLDNPHARNMVEVVECRSSHSGVYISILELKADLRWGEMVEVGNVLV